MSSDHAPRKESPRKPKTEDDGKVVKNEEAAEQETSIIGTPDRAASETAGKRGPGRPRKSSFTSPIADSNGADESSTAESRRSTRIQSTRGQYAHHDQTYDTSSGQWRCLVPGCNWLSDSRAARSFHLRTEHPHYKDFGEFVAVATDHSEEIAARRNARANLTSKGDRTPVEMQQLVEDEEDLVEELDIESEDEEMEDIADPAYDRSDIEEEMIAMHEERARMDNARNTQAKRGRGRPKKGEFDPPGPNSRLRISDPKGRYPCYVEGCDWKGQYRSVRSAHMKHMHRDWVRPPSFTLLRVSRDGDLITPLSHETETSKYDCLVDGCPWKGNFKASRMAHIRNHHKDVELPTRKTQLGGYVANGRYACHEPTCTWRGSSRSTRSNHMKKIHRNFVNTVYSSRSVPCCDCGIALQSHKNFVDHMVCEHGVGGIVQREFNDPRDYEEWFDAVQESFSIDFIKKMGVKQTAQYQVLYLYCAKGGGYRDPRFHRYNKNAITPVRLQLRRRPNRGMIKCGKNCAAFLRVLNWSDGRLTVIGCVEHTGHRMGTPLLRLSPYERDIMDEYLYSIDPASPIECVLDRLREQEGFQADGWECTEKTREDLKQFVTDEDDVTSLNTLLQSESIKDSTFGVVLPSKGNDELSIGFMTEAQRKLWENDGKVLAINEVRLCLGLYDIHIYTAVIFENQAQPRIAATYMTTSEKRAPLLHHLKEVWPEAPITIVTDCSPVWEEIIRDVYQQAFEIDHQIAEWHLLQEWATLCDQTIVNRVDRFSVLCALRRWVRATHPILFEAMMSDLFDALREMDLDEFGTYIDTQLTDESYHKRWSPTNRSQLTDPNNPILELSCRTIREKFVTNEVCKRIDEFVGFYLTRVVEFNQCTIGQVFSTGNVDAQRTPPEWMEDGREEVEHDEMEMVDVMDDHLLPSSAHLFRNHDDIHVHPDMVEIVEEEMEGEVYHEEIVVEESELERMGEQAGPSSGLIRMERMRRRGIEGRGLERETRGEIDLSTTSPRKQKLIEKIKKRMEEANEEELEIYENNISQLDLAKMVSNEIEKRRNKQEEEVGETVVADDREERGEGEGRGEGEEELVEDEVVRT
ncbi:attf-3 [Pristionchus pacificus]|nr:attf-3 [Pristionchus pacificus]